MRRKQHRKIKQLDWVKADASPPPILTANKRFKGAKAEGLTFERKVGKILHRWLSDGELTGKLELGKWFQYSDKGKSYWCQPDLLLITSDVVFILECKLTQTDVAFSQMSELYKPVIECVYRKPVVMVQVCKRLKAIPKNLIACLTEILDIDNYNRNQNYTWQFLGR